MAKIAESGWRGSGWRKAMWGTAAILLLLPLVAMRFTTEMNWDETDFIVIGAMLSIACGTVELAARTTANGAYRLAVAMAVAAAFLLVWMNLAVGIIGTEDNPANLMYGGVIAIAVAGAAIARFRPVGMARALVAAAIAQMTVGLIALVVGLGFTSILDGFFAALWLTSAWLFRKADEPSAGVRSSV